ncbi:outer membrane protein assembly factor BamC [Methylobacter luteus]|uniref:outer membrane protein assembly factor BamC n=1 Tax=Methylobacter luteus TaxID=415 RepID=UPI0003F72BF7|nr:outer membrane protein assembly factor BamC [Methylobacter luteus]
MQITVKNLIPVALLTAVLVSCGTTEEAHYRDTSMLERPPTLVANKPANEQKEADSNSESEEEAKTGLGTKVYMTDSNSTLFVIKQPFDEAWNTLAQALKQQDIEITDRNREEKAYYVTYDPDDYDPGSSFSFFKDDYAEEDYLLKLEARDDGTAISAEAVDKTNPDSSSDNGKPTDGAGRLLKSLHETLRDDLKKE